MSGFIALNASEAWHAAGWSFRAVIREICGVLAETELHRFLTGDVCVVEVDYFDLAAHPSEWRTHFREAARQAFAQACEHGPVGWRDPTCFPRFQEDFRILLSMLNGSQTGMEG